MDFEWTYLKPRDKRPNQHRLTPEQMAEGRAKGRKSSKGKLRGDKVYYQALNALRQNPSSEGIKVAQQWVKDNPEEHSRRCKAVAKERAIKMWAKDGSMRKAINQRKIDKAFAIRELRGGSKGYKRPPRVER
jgi:hypothetical protein